MFSRALNRALGMAARSVATSSSIAIPISIDPFNRSSRIQLAAPGIFLSRPSFVSTFQFYSHNLYLIHLHDSGITS